MKSEAKIKAHKSDDSVSNPRKRARKTTSANQYDNDDDGDSGPGTTVMTFNNEQKDRLYSLHINKEKLRDIHNFFIKEYDFEGTIKSLEGCIYKLKAERTMLSEEDKILLHDILDKLVLDRTQLVLDQFNKSSSTKVTKQFIAKFIKEWETDKSSGKIPKSARNNNNNDTRSPSKRKKDNSSTKGRDTGGNEDDEENIDEPAH